MKTGSSIGIGLGSGAWMSTSITVSMRGDGAERSLSTGEVGT
jgi:hypothetical protein